MVKGRIVSGMRATGLLHMGHLILDCRGLDLRPAMSPVIKTTAGEMIYGYKNLDSAEVIRRGMAGAAAVVVVADSGPAA